ncbi:MAG: hypothetical protein WC054_00500 [Candidatus Nanopelagicales bacterium]
MSESPEAAFLRMWDREPISAEVASASIHVAGVVLGTGQPPCIATAMAAKRIYPELESLPQTEINKIMPSVFTSLLAAEHAQNVALS